jgi:hypothetical protein
MLREPFDDPITTSWDLHGLFDVDRNVATGDVNGEEIASPDRDGNGHLSDDERDEDADGLSNYDELHGRMVADYWNNCYQAETPFHIVYAGVSPTDEDTDGDGVRDGADDQDHDDVPNIMELSRIDASHTNHTNGIIECAAASPLPMAINGPHDYGRVNPFNPCLPDRYSRTCPRFGDETTGSPWDGVINWLALN